VDLPRLRALPSVRSYGILRADPARESGPQATAAAPPGPPRYIEIIEVTSTERFSQDMAQPDIAEIAATFRRYAATPTVLTCAELAPTAFSFLFAAQGEISMTAHQTVPAPLNQVTATPAASPEEANAHFRGRLAFEADPADIAKAIADGTVNFTIVDCRPTGNSNKTHLPGAVSLPWADITEETAAGLPDGLLITYCWGPSCNAATKGAERLSRYGRQVKEMIGGIEYWIREGHPTEGRRPIVRGEEKPLDWGLVV
jgi:rhodanese-related sulfurtransferase